MYKMIEYDTPLTGRGRNGAFKCAGVEIFKSSSKSTYITIAARTTRGDSNSCWFELPVEKIDELIEALKKVKGGR